MAFQEFFKKNFVLVIGITLPVIMMIAFMVIAENTRRNIVAPEYDFLFTGRSYSDGSRDSYAQYFSIKKGQLQVKITKKDQRHFNPLRLYHYEATSKTIREVKFDLPADIKIADMKKDETATFTLPEFDAKKFNTETKSKDGYVFMKHGYHRNGFIINEFFGTGRNRNNKIYLEKNDRRYKIDIPENRIYSREFVAWIEK